MGLSEAQKSVARSNKRFRVLISGRRFGKTTLAIREMLKFASKPNQTVWYVSPTYRMSKEIVFSKLRTILYDLRWVKKINESDLTAYLVNGSIISLKGAENFDSLRGRAINFLILDEFADIKPQTFYEVLRPALADTNGSVLFTGTPKSKSNWSYDMFNMATTDSDHWASWQYTTLDGGFVTEAEIDEARELLDSRTFTQEFEATFVTTGNKIFYNFEREHNVQPYTGVTPSILHIGQDFNYSPMTSVVFAQTDSGLHAIDEIKMNTSNTDEMVDEIKQRYPRHKIFSYADPAGRQNKSSAGGRTDISILENSGFIVKAPRKHTPVRDTINAVNSLLCNANGVRALLVDPKCKNLIDSMDRWNYKESTHQPDKDAGWDHMCDCVRYAVDYLHPVTKQFTPQPPSRWGHKIGTQ